jgi:alpha-beta hydrolase superfamily lysophospholipase
VGGGCLVVYTRPMGRLRVGLALALALALDTAAQPGPATTELLRLPTADGRETAALLYVPAAPARGGLILVHGYGGNFYSGAHAALARALADRGLVALSVNLRDHDTGPKTTRFEETRWDVGAGVDELARRGVAPLAIAGHSLGTNSVLFYLADSRDARVRAVVLLAPPGNAFEWNVRQFGRERATAVLEEAQRLVREGRGQELMVVDLGPLGKALYSAEHLVSVRGPGTRSDPYANIAGVTVPLLLISGAADRLVDHGVRRRLQATATRAPRADLVEIPGADHGFSAHQPQLATVVERWLADAWKP